MIQARGHVIQWRFASLQENDIFSITITTGSAVGSNQFIQIIRSIIFLNNDMLNS